MTVSAGGNTGRPLLLVDVDGVLQPVGRSVPPGYERFTDDDFEVVLRREHGVWLAHLATAFDLVWATTWGGSANRAIGRRLGLAELPHIELSDLPRTGTRKLGAVTEYVGGRALAWIDDELYEDALVGRPPGSSDDPATNSFRRRAHRGRCPGPRCLRRRAADDRRLIPDPEPT